MTTRMTSGRDDRYSRVVAQTWLNKKAIQLLNFTNKGSSAPTFLEFSDNVILTDYNSIIHMNTTGATKDLVVTLPVITPDTIGLPVTIKFVKGGFGVKVDADPIEIEGNLGGYLISTLYGLVTVYHDGLAWFIKDKL